MNADELSWSEADLALEFERYKKELATAGLAGATLHAYEYRAERFLRWRAERGSSGPVSAAGLASALIAFQDDLRSDLKSKGTVHTYVDGASRFLRWLVGDYTPRASKAVVPPDGFPVRKPDRSPMEAWIWEGNVVSRVVTFLAAEGWRIRSVADTERRERGVDIAAERDGKHLAVEVKGYPSTEYVRGPNAGKPKRANPSAMAIQFLAGAVLTAIGLTTGAADLVALALPDVPRYRDLLDEVRPGLSRLGIGILLVEEEGAVHWNLKAIAKPD